MRGRDAQRPRERGGVMAALLVLLVVIGAVAALAWMLFLPVVVTTQIRARTGFDASVARLMANPFTGRIVMQGFVLTNPPTFPVRDFIELREFAATVDVWSVFGDKLVIEAMSIDAGTITLVKNREGLSNAEVLQRNLAPRSAQPLPPASARSEAGKKKVLVRTLALKIDRLVIADHSGRVPRVQDFRLGLDQHYADVTELSQLFKPAVLAHLAPVAAAAVGLLPGDWSRSLDEAAKSGTTLLKEAGRKVEVKVRGYLDALEESKKP